MLNSPSNFRGSRQYAEYEFFIRKKFIIELGLRKISAVLITKRVLCLWSINFAKKVQDLWHLGGALPPFLSKQQLYCKIPMQC